MKLYNIRFKIYHTVEIAMYCNQSSLFLMFTKFNFAASYKCKLNYSKNNLPILVIFSTNTTT